MSNGKLLDLLVLYWDWVHMNHQNRDSPPEMKPSGHTGLNELIANFRVLIPNLSNMSKNGGVRVRPWKNFCDHTLQIVGKCPFW